MAEVRAGVVGMAGVFGEGGETSMHPSTPAFWAGLIWVVAVLLLLALVIRR